MKDSCGGQGYEGGRIRRDGDFIRRCLEVNVTTQGCYSLLIRNRHIQLRDEPHS